MDLMQFDKKTSVIINGKAVPLVGRVDIILEAEKPLIIEMLRIDPKTSITYAEQYEPFQADLTKTRSGLTLRFDVRMMKKIVIDKIIPEENKI